MTEFTHLNDIVVQGSVSSSEQGDLIGSFKSMPKASADNKDKIVLYTGETTGTFRKGMYYISNGSAWVLSDAPLYSTNDYTSEDKAKLDGIAPGAQVNVIETVKVNGATQAVVNKAVNISVPTSYGFKLQVDTATGVISLLDKQGVVLSTINTTINRVIKSGYYDTASGNIVLVTDDNTQINIPVSDLVDTYAADGTYLTLDERTFSLSGSAKAAVDAVANKADDSAVVHKAGDTMTGSLTISKINDPKVILKNTNTEVGILGRGSADVLMYDKNDVQLGKLSSYIHSVNLNSCTTLSAQSKNSDGNTISSWIDILAFPDGTKYINGVTPSIPSDNTTKIPTTAWVNGASTVVHTTGNETIAGTKTFSNIPIVSAYGWNGIYFKSTKYDATVGNEGDSRPIDIRGYDKNEVYCGGVSNHLRTSTTELLLSTRDNIGDGYTEAKIKIVADNTNKDAYATAPATADKHPDNAIVTKGYLQSTMEQASFSKQPYVVAYDPAVAITNPTTCITYQGRCASYIKPVMSNNVLDRGSWTDDEPLLKRIQYCTFRADGTIKEVLYKNDLNKVWIKNFADNIPDTPIYSNDELMQYCATLTQPSEIPSDAAESSIATLDTMVVIPTLYTYGDERGFRISFDPSQGEAEAHTIDGEVCKYIAIGVYLGTVKDDKLMSVSHAEPTRTLTRYDFRAKLIGKDESHGKWRLYNYWDSRLMKMLSTLVGGSLNSQAVFGNGMTASMGIDASDQTDTWTRNYATYTGKTDTVGMFGQSESFTQKYDVDNFGKYDNGNTTAVRQVKCLIEAPWGQCWQFMDDHCNEPSTGRIFAGKNSAGVIHPLDNNNGLYLTNQVANPTLIDHICTIIDPTDELPGLLTEAKSVYSNVIHTESAAWGLPAVKAGSSSTGTCDGWWMLPRSSAGVKNGLVGGSSHNYSGCGSFHWYGSDTLSGTHVYVGARPVFVFN